MSTPIKIYMGIPSMGDRWDFQNYSLRELEKRYAGEVELVYPERLCHRFGHDFARNEIVEEFLESDCDILWFLDADIAPPPHVLDLVTIHGSSGWLAAGAPYPLWMYPPGHDDLACLFTVYNGNAASEHGNQGLVMSPVLHSGTEWVDGLATGCLFLRRELFAKLEKPYFQFKRKQESQEVVEGEDLGFALKLQRLGIKYFTDHGMVCGHYKKVNLLEVNNYAINYANAKILAYDASIRSQIEEACKKAYLKGRLDEQANAAQADIRASSGVRRTASGLILPT